MEGFGIGRAWKRRVRVPRAPGTMGVRRPRLRAALRSTVGAGERRIGAVPLPMALLPSVGRLLR